MSFQGESFVYQTPRAAPRRAPAGSSRRRGEAENDRSRNRGQGAKTSGAANALAQSLDCSLHRKESILAAVRLLRSSMAPDSAASEAVTDNSGSSDTDAASPDSCCNLAGGGTTWPGIVTPARFWQETNSRLRRLPESGWPHSSASARRSFLDDSMLPRVPGTSPSRSQGSQGSASPSRGLDGKEAGPPVKAPSIISFATEVRRANKGENKIEEAHRLRLLDNRHLQWRCVNARVDAALLARGCSAEKALHSAWKDISVLRDSVSFKRSKLQLQKQKLKNFAILKGQISYLEEWSHIENRHLSSLSAAIKALKASTIRLPIVGGAKADAQGVKEVVSSSVDVMNTMASSMCSLLSKVEGTSSTVFELAKVAAQEQMLLDQSRDLFSAVAVMHVKQCSLQAHILQGKQKLGQMQL